MRTGTVLAGLTLALFMIPSSAIAQTSGSTGRVIVIVGQIDDDTGIIWYIDTARKKIIVYGLQEGSPPKFEFLAARDFEGDFFLEEYNNTGLAPAEVESMVADQELKAAQKEALLKKIEELRNKREGKAPKAEIKEPTPEAKGSAGRSTSAGGIIAVVTEFGRDDEQVLVLTDTNRNAICTYWFHPTNSKLEFISARNIQHDVKVRSYNLSGLTPDDIDAEIDKERRRQRLADQLRKRRMGQR